MAFLDIEEFTQACVEDQLDLLSNANEEMEASKQEYKQDTLRKAAMLLGVPDHIAASAWDGATLQFIIERHLRNENKNS